MRKLALVLFAVLILLSVASVIIADDGGWYYERYWDGCYWRYRKMYYPVQQVKKEVNTTIVNNLVGIPVPVQYTQPIAQQGTTVYGYSDATSAYSNIDLGLLYNQAGRLTDQAQQLAGQAAADFQSLVQAEGQNRADVAKIYAQGYAAREALRAAKGDPAQLIQRSFTFKVTQDGAGQMRVEKVEQGGGQDFNLATVKELDLSSIIKSRCIMCHGNEKANGNLNFLQALTDAQQRACLDRITSDDPKRRMPKNGSMTLDEKMVFFREMGGQAPAQK